MTTTRNTKRKDKARVVLRKGESQRKMASTISVGLPWMAGGILFMPQPWRNFGKGKRHSGDSLEGIKAESTVCYPE